MIDITKIFSDDQKNKAYQRKKKKLADRIAEKQAEKARLEQQVGQGVSKKCMD